MMNIVRSVKVCHLTELIALCKREGFPANVGIPALMDDVQLNASINKLTDLLRSAKEQRNVLG